MITAQATLDLLSKEVPKIVFGSVGDFRVSGITTAEPETPMDVGALRKAFTAGAYICASVGSESTIWPHGINYIMRAWHDWHHAFGDKYVWNGPIGLGFDFESEAYVARSQHMDWTRKVKCSGEMHRAVARVLAIEVIGQARYFRRRGGFVCDQREFFRLAWTEEGPLSHATFDAAFILGEGDLV